MFIGKDGWPVELIEGKRFTNFLRILIHTSIFQAVKAWLRRAA